MFDCTEEVAGGGGDFGPKTNANSCRGMFDCNEGGGGGGGFQHQTSVEFLPKEH